MTASAPGTDNAYRYDLYFRAGKAVGGMYVRLHNRGVALEANRIAWTLDGQDDEAPLTNIAAIRLETGGDAKSPVATCHIGFADGYRLIVSNGSAYGLRDAGQAAIYRAFIRDLHTRLAALPDAKTQFEAGYTEGRYQIVFAAVILLGLIVVALPLVLLLITRDVRVLGALIVGGFLIWPMTKMIQANAPRTYDPKHVPDELMP